MGLPVSDPEPHDDDGSDDEEIECVFCGYGPDDCICDVEDADE